MKKILFGLFILQSVVIQASPVLLSRVNSIRNANNIDTSSLNNVTVMECMRSKIIRGSEEEISDVIKLISGKRRDSQTGRFRFVFAVSQSDMAFYMDNVHGRSKWSVPPAKDGLLIRRHSYGPQESIELKFDRESKKAGLKSYKKYGRFIYFPKIHKEAEYECYSVMGDDIL